MRFAILPKCTKSLSAMHFGIKEELVILLKGMLMGSADIIPGVSGGTIALIVGIYERLVNSLKDIPKFLIPLGRREIGEAWTEFWKIDFALFIPLALGIGTAFIIGSYIITFLMEDYPAYIYAFFFGLILASVRVVHRRIKDHKILDMIHALGGFVLAFWIVGLPALKTTPSYWFIFLCGMIAICAMLLPGISGAFMLLMLGQYKFMLDALHQARLGYIFSFAAGAVISLIGSSWVLSYLLKKHHGKTMYFLTGLMIGALRQPFENVVYAPGMEWNILQILLVTAFAAIGVALVITIDRYEKE